MSNGQRHNLLGISGKAGSGKDTVGKIIQWIVTAETGYLGGAYTNEQCKEWLGGKFPGDTSVQEVSNYQIKKYADKLKDMVCLLIGCTRADLEDREFKEKELGEEWNIWVLVPNPDHNLFDGNCQLQDAIFSSSDEAKNYIKEHKIINVLDIEERALTPRLLLQLMGTECGRDIIHPNIWVNALFADYKPIGGKMIPPRYPKDYTSGLFRFPNWIITDVRFPNELKAIKDRGGMVIRLERDEKPIIGQTYTIKDRFDGKDIIKGCIAEYDVRGYDNFVYRCPEHLIYRDGDYVIVREGEHESETALDSHAFSRIIQNDGSIEELVEKVKQIIQ